MKSRFEAAAELAGHSSLSDFLISTAQERSAKILSREARITLSPEAYDELLDRVREAGSPGDLVTKFILDNGRDSIPKASGDRTDEAF